AMIVRRVLGFGTVTMQSIYGALSAYLIIGLMFAAFFAAIYHLSGDPFFAPGEPNNTQTFQYFSFTTLTTLGYGDFTAAGNSGRAVAVLEALTGQVFLATLVSRLVAACRGSGERQSCASRPAHSPRQGEVRRGHWEQRERIRGHSFAAAPRHGSASARSQMEMTLVSDR